MARLTQQASIHTTGTSYENEPIIKSDAASSDVMQWLASTGTSNVKIIEDADNNVALQLDGETLRNNINGDGAGLHFDGSAGNVHRATPPALGTKFSFEFIVQATSWDSYSTLIDFGSSGRFLFYTTDGTQLKIYQTGDHGFGVSVLDDLKVHHLVVTVDGTAAILYDNGNQVATTTIESPTLDLAASARIGSNYGGTGGYFNGTFYRARLHNRTLSAPEVKSAFEGSNVDFADQWGSQTELVTGGDLASSSGWSSDAGVTYDSSNNEFDFGDVNIHYGVYRTAIGTIVKGKKYRTSFEVKNYVSGSVAVRVGSAFGTHRTANGTYVEEFICDDSDGNWVGANAKENNTELSVTNISVVEIGAVTDWDFSAANPTQSNQLQDRSNNSVDGTINSGVVQVNPVEQVNTKGISVGTTAQTVADGEIVVGGNVGIGKTPSSNQAIVYGPSVQVGQAASLIGASGANNLFLSNNALYNNSNWLLTNGGYAGQLWLNDGSLTFRQKSSSGSADGIISWENALHIDSAGLTTFSGGIVSSAMPTSDPSVAGQLWNDSGTVKISSG